MAKKSSKKRGIAKRERKKQRKQALAESSDGGHAGKSAVVPAKFNIPTPSQQFPEDLLKSQNTHRFLPVDEAYELQQLGRSTARAKRGYLSDAKAQRVKNDLKRWLTLVKGIEAGKVESPAEAYVRLAQSQVNTAKAAFSPMPESQQINRKKAQKALNKAESLLKQACRHYHRKTGFSASELYLNRNWEDKDSENAKTRPHEKVDEVDEGHSVSNVDDSGSEEEPEVFWD